MTIQRVLSLCCCAIVLCLASCAERRPLYANPSQLSTGIYVKVKEAYIRGDRLYVKTWMMNGTQGPVTIDRDGIALRLSDGRVLPRAEGTFTQHTPYNLAPGVGRDVHVDFKDEAREFEGVTGATLIVGGVSFGTDPTPRLAGEVPLSTSYVSMSSAPPPPQASAPAPQTSAPPPQASAPPPPSDPPAAGP